MKIQDILRLNLIKREKLNEIIKWMDDDKLVIITGSRQVGKTSILYLLIQKLSKKTENIFYFDLKDFELLKIFNSGTDSFY